MWKPNATSQSRAGTPASPSTGTARVLDALEQGKVETLLLTDPDDKEVTSGELIGPADRVLPYIAIGTGTELVQIDERLVLRRRIRRDTSAPLNAGAC